MSSSKRIRRSPSRSQGRLSAEHEPLLRGSQNLSNAKDPVDGAAFRVGEEIATNGEDFDDVPSEKRQLGVFSAVFLISNRVIGTGIYATPSLILWSCGSVGMSLVMWLLGSLIAAAGTAVYIELGTGLPRSGGEKNYLEFIFRRPKFLVSCIYAMYTMILASTSAGAVVFGEYMMHALSLPITRTNTRLAGVVALTFAFLLHGTRLNWGLRVQNTLGIFSLTVMLFIILAGLSSLLIPGLVPEPTDNLKWSSMWKGTRVDTNSFVTGLYSVIWNFIGYSNANYVLSEVRDPVRTIKRAAPLAMLSLTTVYLLVNVAYFAVVSKEDILDGGRVVAALFFRNLFGQHAERIVSAIIAFSVLGNVMSVLFSSGRVVQECGREGILPYSSWFASNRPFNTPFVGLFSQWLASVITAAAPPPGEAFNFIVQYTSFPLVLINTSIAAGLLFLHTRWAHSWGWEPPFRAWTSVTAFFLASNVFLAIVPLIPPAPGFSVFEHLPYWLPVVASLAIGFLGAVYWYVWCIYLPEKGGYVLVRVPVVQEDGVSRHVFQKVAIE